MRSSPTGPSPSELSRRALVGALLGLFGIACHHERSPDTSVPSDRVGRDFRQLRRRIRKHVDDPERSEAAPELVVAAQRQFADIGQLLIDWREALAMLPGEHDRADLLAAVNRSYSEALGDIAREVGRLAVALRYHVTAAEWAGCFPRRSSRADRRDRRGRRGGPARRRRPHGNVRSGHARLASRPSVREVIGEEPYAKITHDIRAKLNKQQARRESKKD